jgi:FMN phosphatase YigB (HAD superfamily)
MTVRAVFLDVGETLVDETRFWESWITLFIRRGPWGYLHATRPGVELADARIDALDELPSLLSRLQAL